ncbi:anti-sigma B factor antagonist [Dongia mobilis]|uniref:Anti-sigma factor antagonist n=1 Tax=Dongia mobilis TaxID=578943 RepID=A0A4V3DEV2_9PROT|nr:STAS domain-containing protein [Dongia mobilis]TDQ83260.1 anti-sigma B factor antagonist [Dongia mobilis]
MTVTSIKEEQGRTVIALSGEIDLENAGDVRKALLAALKHKKDVLVDLSAVSYIDSSGIASLVEGLQVARKQKNELSLVAVSARALRVLELARLDKVFSIHPDIASAIAARP